MEQDVFLFRKGENPTLFTDGGLSVPVLLYNQRDCGILACTVTDVSPFEDPQVIFNVLKHFGHQRETNQKRIPDTANIRNYFKKNNCNISRCHLFCLKYSFAETEIDSPGPKLRIF